MLTKHLPHNILAHMSHPHKNQNKLEEKNKAFNCYLIYIPPKKRKMFLCNLDLALFGEHMAASESGLQV